MNDLKKFIFPICREYNNDIAELLPTKKANVFYLIRKKDKITLDFKQKRKYNKKDCYNHKP
ncbi:MAG: hypothetical protein KKD38_06350 [Candidatus Delongbacteria bacterium]|nr:hypothetical protein [Candidatus Delongbacteria bacterium]